jgi:pimeloyl-ACP methyl ester carboxylesterase
MVSSIWGDLLGAQVRYEGTKYRTCVIEYGEGVPLILLHGGGGHAEAYSRNVVRLGGHFRAMAMDMVWHGLSSKPPFQGEAVPVYGDQVLDLMDTLQNPLRGIDAAERLASLIPGSRAYLMRDSAIWSQWEHAEEHDREVIAVLQGEN